MSGQSWCASCGSNGTTELCPHHYTYVLDEWCATNKIMCDFIHRGVVPPRPAENPNDPVKVEPVDG